MANNISGINPSGTPSAIDVANAGEQAISFNEQLPDLTQKLQEALMTKFNESPLFSQRQTAQQGFLNQPSQTRDYISQMQNTSGVPLSPTQQDAIMQARRSAAYVPLASNTLMMGSAYGGLENMVKSGTDAFTAAGEGMTKRADLMNTMRQQALDQQFKQQQLATDQAYKQSTLALNYAKLQLQQAGGNLSATERLQAKTALAALTQLNKFKTNYTKNINNIDQFTANTGPVQGFMTNLFKNWFPKSPLVDHNLASMQSDIGPMRDSILNAISGANVSAQEADRVQSWIPSNTKSPEENARNLRSLEAWLTDKYSTLTSPLINLGGDDGFIPD